MHHKAQQQLPSWLFEIAKNGIQKRDNTVKKLSINQLIQKPQL